MLLVKRNYSAFLLNDLLFHPWERRWKRAQFVPKSLSPYFLTQGAEVDSNALTKLFYWL